MFLVGGCLVKFGSSTINGLLKDALSHVKDAVPEPVGDQLENFDLAEFIGTNILHVLYFFLMYINFFTATGDNNGLLQTAHIQMRRHIII